MEMLTHVTMLLRGIALAKSFRKFPYQRKIDLKSEEACLWRRLRGHFRLALASSPSSLRRGVLSRAVQIRLLAMCTDEALALARAATRTAA
jgi:hypothetical protein